MIGDSLKRWITWVNKKLKHGLWSDKLNTWLIRETNNYVSIPTLTQYTIIGPNATVAANGTLWFTVNTPPELNPIAVVGYYWSGVSGNAAILNVYSWALSSTGASFAIANTGTTACTFKPYVRFLGYMARGVFNILRGTKAPNMGTGKWIDATWRVSGAGTSITTEAISDSPVPGVTKAFKIVNNASGEYGFAQDAYPMFGCVGQFMTFSVWLKGSVGSQVSLEPYWTGTAGEAETYSEIITLDTENWKRYTVTSPAIKYEHVEISLGYIYLKDPNKTLYVCAPMLEWGTEAHDWTPSLKGD